MPGASDKDHLLDLEPPDPLPAIAYMTVAELRRLLARLRGMSQSKE